MQSRASLRRDFEKTDNPRLLPGTRPARRPGRRASSGVRVADGRLCAPDKSCSTRAPEADLPADRRSRHRRRPARRQLARPSMSSPATSCSREEGTSRSRWASSTAGWEAGSRSWIPATRPSSARTRRSPTCSSASSSPRGSSLPARAPASPASPGAPAASPPTSRTDAGGRDGFRVSHLFVSAGRRPNTDDLGLETVGVRPEDGGLSRRWTSGSRRGVPGIWAAGDIRGGPMFTHTSWDDLRILLSQFTGGRVADDAAQWCPTRSTRIPSSAASARPKRRPARQAARSGSAGSQMRDNGKARELSETDGFIKVVVDASDGPDPRRRLLGHGRIRARPRLRGL